jgi:hypothetical protein
VLNLLTKYLLQYRTVTIPHVGTIELIQQPSQLSIADKIIQPPSFSAEIKKEEEVSSHQLNFLNTLLKKESHSVLKDLKQFGDNLHDKINGPGFEWNGFGRFDRSTQSFSIPIESLSAITAERVMRENPDHQVLVGDRQTSSYQIADEKAGIEVEEKPRSIFIAIGWVLFALSILAIAFFIYQGKLRVNASGSRLQAVVYVMSK